MTEFWAVCEPPKKALKNQDCGLPLCCTAWYTLSNKKGDRLLPDWHLRNMALWKEVRDYKFPSQTFNNTRLQDVWLAK